ncbi:uncharacterized protein [Lolium perenne]|uniref:uncharacterized protein n=1 Tax=Lolium perenne TaxID=4522 RepID=UPI0021F564B2|nr:uncharacterized protein LOC127343753 [Lolium perenne]XP_051225895.1 uncharacterized protein LOC127343753 [Lolium perenne]XP_051225896.1 uncharacterized protein LOC127343753 [Lolium perenne]
MEIVLNLNAAITCSCCYAGGVDNGQIVCNHASLKCQVFTVSMARIHFWVHQQILQFLIEYLEDAQVHQLLLWIGDHLVEVSSTASQKQRRGDVSNAIPEVLLGRETGGWQIKK